MEYPETLSDDLKYLAEFYQWNAEDKKEVRAAFTDSHEMVRFFTNLAAAHRAGYQQGASNNYIRLNAWCLQNGLADPFSDSFDISALDARTA